MRRTRMFLTYLAAGALCLGGVAAILVFVAGSRTDAAAEPPELVTKTRMAATPPRHRAPAAR